MPRVDHDWARIARKGVHGVVPDSAVACDSERMTEPSTSRRTALIVRHAKAESTAVRDRDRRLTDRGLSDAWAAGAAVSAALADVSGAVLALVSPAARAYETWQQVAARLPGGVQQRVVGELYEAGVDDVVELLRGLPADVAAAIVVGHNPTMHATVHTLADGGDDTALQQLDDRGFPTASVAVLVSDASWSDMVIDCCWLSSFTVGRG